MPKPKIPPAGSTAGRQARINECLAGLGPDYATNVSRITALCGELLGGDCAHYHRLDGSVLSAPGTWHCPEDFEPEVPAEGRICLEVMRRKGESPLLIRDLPSTPYAASDPAVARHGLKTFLGAAVRCGGRAVGSLCVVFRKDFEPAENDTLVLSLLASALGAEEAHRRAEARLRESEQKYRTLYESSRDAIMLLFPPDWKFTGANRATLEMFHARDEEHFTSVGPWEVSPKIQGDGEPSSAKARRMIETAMKEGSHFFEWTHKRIGGEPFPATVLLTRIDLQGKAGLQATVRDVSREKAAEEALRQSETRMKAIWDCLPTGVVVIDTETHSVVHANNAALAMMGLSRQRVVGHVCHRHVCPAEEGKCPITDLGQKVDESERTLLRADGGSVPILKTVVPFQMEGRECLLECFMDITARKKAEKEAEHWKSLVESVIDNVPFMIFMKDAAELRFVLFNRAGEDLLGRDRRELLGKNDLDFFPPGQAASFMAKDREALWSGGIVDIPEEPIMTAKRGQRLLHTKKIALRDPDGSREYLLGISEDITDRKAAEAALRASEEKYRTLVETTATGYLILDREGRVLDANAEYVRLTGHRELSDILGRSVVEWTAPHDRDRNAAAVARCVEEGLVRHLLVDYVGPGGKLLPVEISATTTGRGRTLRIISLCRDVSERRALERSLQDMRLQRLESLGTLAGGIAHDFNNMLTGVMGNLSLLGLRVKGRLERTWVREAEKACQAAKGLSRQLLTFASGGAPVAEVRDLAPLLRSAVLFAARGSRLRCAFRMGKGPFLAKVDEGQFVQAVQNLVLNSAQAVDGPGTLDVELSAVRLPAGALPPLGPGRYARVRLRDSGPGISAEDLPRIFDPFFSTKGAGRGLGLSVCHSIVARHGGHLAAESRPGQGTTFTLHLPAAGKESKPASSRGTRRTESSKGRILVMDDDKAVLRVLKQALESRGCLVATAPDGETAVARWRRARASRRPFDAVILDLTVVGGMGGCETLKRLKELDTQVKAIVTSGYSTDPVLSDYERHGFCAKLAKPFRLEDLSAALAAALSRPAAARERRGARRTAARR